MAWELNSSEGVLKKRIKLRESNERLNLAISFYIQQLSKKAYFTIYLSPHDAAEDNKICY